MNKERRKELQEICSLIIEAQVRLETFIEEEEAYKDSMPEYLQSSERYERAEEVISNLDDAHDSLDETLGYIEEAME